MEWRLYPPVIAYWEARDYLVSSQVTHPGGPRWELDVVAFTPEMDDVRVTEAKVRASGALVEQCLDRLRLAPRVYAAVPEDEVERLLGLVTCGPARALGVLAVGRHEARLVREARAVWERREEGPARVLERVLRGEVGG